jgi:hypothetical protein
MGARYRLNPEIKSGFSTSSNSCFQCHRDSFSIFILSSTNIAALSNSLILSLSPATRKKLLFQQKMFSFTFCALKKRRRKRLGLLAGLVRFLEKAITSRLIGLLIFRSEFPTR